MTVDLDYTYYSLITHNDLEGLKAAFEEHCNSCEVKPYGQSLILHAVLENKLEILNFLIQQNCNPNQADESGLTPLHAAAQNNNVEAAEILLSANAQIDLEDKFGNTSLLDAVHAYQSDMSMISLLIKAGADPFHPNKSEISPYRFAETTKKNEVIAFFRTNGLLSG